MKNILALLLIGFVFFAGEGKAQGQEIRYVALGDSYTIGTGATPETSWPAVLTQKLQAENIPLKLIANLGRNGWTTANVLEGQLPILEKIKPDFVTLLIGVNDWVQGVPEGTFRQNFIRVLDGTIAQLSDKQHLLIVTIPDFSVMPVGKRYSAGRNIVQGIARFNEIVKEEAQSRHLTVVDIFPLSQTLSADPAMVASDGLHPSAKAYSRWAEFIFPEAKQVIEE